MDAPAAAPSPTPLHAWMKEHRVSINALARALGLSAKSTSKIVRGETRSPKASTAQKIVEFTKGGVSLGELVRPAEAA